MTLGFLARGLVLVLAAHAVVSTIAALAVVLVERRREARRPSPPGVHARRLSLLRLAPSLAAMAVAWLGVSLAFLLWEPRGETEAVGPFGLAAAGMGAALVLSGAWRAVAALWRTRRVHADLRLATRAALDGLPVPAFEVETAFPVVALVGLFVPRLFVARAVVKACSADEFRTVMAHEAAHARARDNLRRIAMAAAPDVLAWIPAGSRIQHAWAHAAELAADEAAARDEEDRLHLASALVKVARLADPQAAPLPASAFHGGEPIAERVRRLVDPSALHTPPAAPRLRPATVAALVAGAVLLVPAAYASLEALLRVGLR